MKHKIFFLKNKLFRSFAYKVYKDSLQNQHLSRQELDEMNFYKKKRIVTYAYENSKFYKNHFDKSNFHPSNLIKHSDWDNVPILTRQDIIDNFDEIFVKKQNKFKKSITTGGSSGTPLKVFHDLRFPNEILGWRLLGWWGTSFGGNFANIYRSKPRSLLNKLLWYPSLKANLNASSMSIEDMKIFTKELNKIKPEIIQGYVGAVEQYANFILDNNIKVPRPKLCWTTSAPITSVQKKTIEKAFKAKVMDQYGCCEIFWIAQECPKQEGLHVNYDYRDVTILDKNNLSINHTSEIGRLAITDFENFVFPLIKYINGDEGSFKSNKCSCGIKLPLLNPIKGRSTDCILLPDKTVIGGDYLTTIFDHVPDAVKGFQVRQLKNSDLIIYYIPNQKFNGQLNLEILKLKTVLEEKVKGLIRIDFKSVNEIAHDRGKNRYIINEMLKD